MCGALSEGVPSSYASQDQPSDLRLDPHLDHLSRETHIQIAGTPGFDVFSLKRKDQRKQVRRQGLRINVGTQICLKWQLLRRGKIGVKLSSVETGKQVLRHVLRFF